ncbi:MAG: curli production assembly protein CsgG [Bryobacteraceae bacterium]|nr:curli production assembly protein CsgG [Bryobacteraceae bacterium]MDW8378922.1 CsgG/HfaB family protein [Bryobacterales bacterium]
MGLRLVAALILFFSALPGEAQQQNRKRRVAVLNFDYATVQDWVQMIFNSNVDVGKGVADLLVDKLVSSGVYQVYERKEMDKILNEQNFSNSDRANPATAARIGQLIGVDAIIIGSITQFGRDDRSTEIGALGRVAGRYGISGVGRKESKAVVALNARIINVDTGEVIGVASGQGTSTRSGAALLGSGGAQTASGGGYYDMRSANFASTILGEAVGKATEQLAAGLNGNADRISLRTVKLQALVADVSGDTVIINAGSRVGVKVGDKLLITRSNREVKDPATGRVIKRIMDQIGELIITEVDESSATGKFKGPATPQVGDTVKTPEN